MEKKDVLKEIEYLTLYGRFKESLKRIKDYKTEYGADDIVFTKEALINGYTKNYLEGLKCCQLGLQYNINNSKLYSLMGLMYENLRKSNMAFILYEHAEILSKIDKQNIDPPKELYVKESDYAKVTVKGLSVIIIANGNEEYTEVCIEAIKRYVQRENIEIIVVDYNNFKVKDEFIKVVKAEEDYEILSAISKGVSVANPDNNLFIIKNNSIVMVNTALNLELALYSSEKAGDTCAVSNVAKADQKIEVNCNSFKDYIAFSEKNNISGSHTYNEITTFEPFAFILKRNLANSLTKNTSTNENENLFLTNESTIVSCFDSFAYRIL